MKKSDKKQLHQLYIELVKLQTDVIATNKKLLIILEGRDTSGKDGTIKRIVKHLSPRETKVVALGKPGEEEQNQWFFQRYTEHLPAKGEIVIFNRSWYNRAGVEPVMGFCTQKQYDDFFVEVELFEKMLSHAGFILVKYYLDISKEKQRARLEARKKDPLKQWKISPIDEKALGLWDSYSEARNKMLQKTNFEFAPWYIANANDKGSLRIALISHLLSHIAYNRRDSALLKENAKQVLPVTKDSLIKNLHH